MSLDTILDDVCTPFSDAAAFAWLTCAQERASEARIMAVDAAIQLITDGRWDSDRVGRMLGLGIKFTKRVVDVLAQTAETSQLHNLQIFKSAVNALAMHPYVVPGLEKLFALIWEWQESLQLAVEDQDAVEYLQSFDGTGKIDKLAQKILSFEPDEAANLTEAYEAAISGRLNCQRELIK